jgi:ribosomal protection tetracycline resistance protein
MKFLNLGILAHVDAGKTSLTERLLYTAGVIDEIGSVDAGSTQTDSLKLEQQRGITIKSAVASFVVNDTTINLIDTPGHPDSIAEVERVLSVLDGVVLVVSAVEGIQPQTRILMRTLQRLCIPTLLYVNKIDRGGARYEDLLRDVAKRLTPTIIPMGSVRGLGTRAADYVPYSANDAPFTAQLTDRLAEHNEAILASHISEISISYSRLKQELAMQTKHSYVCPVFFGSAITGAGVDELFTAIPELLPTAKGKASDVVSATVFKVERGKAGEKIAYVRMFSGTIRARDKLHFGQDKEGKVSSVQVFGHGGAIERTAIVAGEIGKLRGLGDIQIGDAIGVPRVILGDHYFAPPTLETVIVPRHAANKGKLRLALDRLAEQDPLINLRQDDTRNELFVSLYGEVQKDVIRATLANDFGVDVDFRKTTPICIERPIGTGAEVKLLQEETNPTSATMGLRIEPGPPGSGVRFCLNVIPRHIPFYIFKTTDSFVEHMTQYIYSALQEGLFGWQVTDCIVTMDECSYYVGDGPTKPFSDTPRTTAADFRKLTPIVLMAALRQAGTVVCEPICHFELEIPASTLSSVLSVLAKFGAARQTTAAHGASYVLKGSIPAARVNELQQQLPALTSGEGFLEYVFDRYEPSQVLTA